MTEITTSKCYAFIKQAQGKGSAGNQAFLSNGAL